MNAIDIRAYEPAYDLADTVDQRIIKLLDHYGHLRIPFGEKADDIPADSSDKDFPTKLGDVRVMRAVKSYQDFMHVTLEPLMAKHYPNRRSAAVRVDGVVGPAMIDLFKMDRCLRPDYTLGKWLPGDLGFDDEEVLAAESTAPAVGQGPWKRCHNIGDFHSCTVKFTNSAPSWLKELLPEVFRRVHEAYAEVGLSMNLYQSHETVPDKHLPVMIDASFVSASAGWIGLAVLGNRGLGCGGNQLWCRYLSSYTGGSSAESRINQWTTLIKHELGHNCRYDHTRGGVMNPSIINGLPISWRGDPLWSSLTTDFGGEKIPTDTPPPGPPPTPVVVTGILSIQHQGQNLGDYILIPKPRI